MNTTLIATDETDQALRNQEFLKGYLARQTGEPRDSCPWDLSSMVAKWWLEGYDNT